MKYAIIIERSPDGPRPPGVGAYAPDLPGVGVVGDTVDEVKQLIREAIELHLEGLRADGEPAPPPLTQIDYIETTAA